MQDRIKVGTGSIWESTVGYSRVIRVGDRVEVAGTTAMRDGKVIGVGDAYAQTLCILEIIQESLAAVGASMTDVIRTRMYVTDISMWQAIGRAHGQFFSEISPVATMVQVQALIHPDVLVEMEAEALVACVDRGAS